MNYQHHTSFLARHRTNTVAGRARFEARVSRIAALIRPLVFETMTLAVWPKWFELQMQQHGQTIMAEEADSLARQALTYREQLDWLLPDVDEATSNRHAAVHVARARGFHGSEGLMHKLDEGLRTTSVDPATT